jgi:hypothetical protein
MRLCLLAAFSLTLIGCASSVPRIDASRLNELKRGETTITEVVGRFGRPSILSKNIDGTQTAAYMHAEGRSDAASFVPLVTALVGKTEANVESVIFNFDVKGVLSDYRSTHVKTKTPALAKAETAVQTNAETTTPTKPETAALTNAGKPTQPNKKASSGNSDPWLIQLHPSGYVENRP